MTKTALILLVLAGAACKSDSDGRPRQAATDLPDLTQSLDAVRADFNAHKGEARFITLLSPT